MYGHASDRLRAPLAVMANHLHVEATRAMGTRPDYSRSACILCSIIARDFLRAAGHDAEVASVNTVIARNGTGKRIGAPTRQRLYRKTWNGHLVTVVPSEKFVIDPTLASRVPADIPLGLCAVPFSSRTEVQWDLPVLASLSVTRNSEPPVDIWWLSTPANDGWMETPDAKRTRIHAAVVRALLAKLPASDPHETIAAVAART